MAPIQLCRMSGEIHRGIAQYEVESVGLLCGKHEIKRANSGSEAYPNTAEPSVRALHDDSERREVAGNCYQMDRR